MSSKLMQLTTPVAGVIKEDERKRLSHNTTNLPPISSTNPYDGIIRRGSGNVFGDVNVFGSARTKRLSVLFSEGDDTSDCSDDFSDDSSSSSDERDQDDDAKPNANGWLDGASDRKGRIAAMMKKLEEEEEHGTFRQLKGTFAFEARQFHDCIGRESVPCANTADCFCGRSSHQLVSIKNRSIAIAKTYQRRVSDEHGCYAQFSINDVATGATITRGSSTKRSVEYGWIPCRIAGCVDAFWAGDKLPVTFGGAQAITQESAADTRVATPTKDTHSESEQPHIDTYDYAHTKETSLSLFVAAGGAVIGAAEMDTAAKLHARKIERKWATNSLITPSIMSFTVQGVVVDPTTGTIKTPSEYKPTAQKKLIFSDEGTSTRPTKRQRTSRRKHSEFGRGCFYVRSIDVAVSTRSDETRAQVPKASSPQAVDGGIESTRASK